MHKPDTKPSLNGIQQLIQEFFQSYPYMQHLDMSADVFRICYLDELAGLSYTRRQSLLEYLQATNALFQQIHSLVEPLTPEQFDHRLKAEKLGDELVLGDVDEGAMLKVEPGRLLFEHTGLYKALELLGDLTTAAENHPGYPDPQIKELHQFGGLLRQILIAVYVQYQNRYKNIIKNPE
ncbi:hypothetical protein SAMN05216436_103238 [bacterium A37T11]|nr:hypothetical protein SAMN05216436_103238 [bacterium A37T11]